MIVGRLGGAEFVKFHAFLGHQAAFDQVARIAERIVAPATVVVAAYKLADIGLVIKPMESSVNPTKADGLFE